MPSDRVHAGEVAERSGEPGKEGGWVGFCQPPVGRNGFLAEGERLPGCRGCLYDADILEGVGVAGEMGRGICLREAPVDADGLPDSGSGLARSL